MRMRSDRDTALPFQGIAGASSEHPKHSRTRSAVIALHLLWVAWPFALVTIVALTTIGGLVPVAVASLQRELLNVLVPASGNVKAAHGPDQKTVAIALSLGMAGLISATAPYGQRYLESQMTLKLGLTMQDRLYQAINSFPGIVRFELPVYYDKIQLIRQIGETTVARLVTSALNGGRALITIIGFAAALETMNSLLLVAVMSSAIPAVVAQVRNSRRRNDLNVRNSPARRRQVFYSGLLSDRNAAKEVRLFGLADFLRRRMLAEISRINEGMSAMNRAILVAESAFAVTGAVISASGLIWVVDRVAAGRLPVGDVSMLAISIIAVQTSISGVVNSIGGVYQSLDLFGHYADVVSADSDLPITVPSELTPILNNGIEVRGVWFRYDDAHPWVLRGVNLFIPQGQSIALVGLNGSGKSTLVKLLCRMYDPQRGDIFWDGVNIRDMDPARLRDHIGTIFQDYMAYDLSAAENIGVGDLNHMSDRNKITAMAADAGVHEKLKALPRGYDTLLSRQFIDFNDFGNAETGVLLSGGEWQKVAFARGLMRADRDLLILDEPTAGLDAAAEYEIHKRLQEMRSGKTSLLISHRLSSVRDADSIVVLQGGVIRECGKHSSLMMRQGEYWRLFTLQAEGYRAGD